MDTTPDVYDIPIARPLTGKRGFRYDQFEGPPETWPLFISEADMTDSFDWDEYADAQYFAHLCLCSDALED